MRKILLSSKETAEKLHITRQTLSKWNLPSKLKIGGKTYYKTRDIERIQEVGLDQFVEECNNPERFDTDAAFRELGIDFQEVLIDAFNESDIDKIFRFIFLDSAEWQEIRNLPSGKFICFCEEVHDNLELNYWATDKEIDDSLEQMRELASDKNTKIIRYNVLPRETFSALYERVLIYELILFSGSDDYITKKCKERINNLLAFMMPFCADFEHV